MSDTLKVTLAYDYTDKSGKNHKADASPTLPAQEALDLLQGGRARTPDNAPAESAAPASKEK